MTSFLIERERCFLQPRGECKYLTTPTAEQYLPTHEQDKFFLTPVTAAGLPEKTHATFLVSAEHKYDEAAQVNPSVSVEQASSTPSDQKKVQLPLRPVYVYSDEDRKEAEEEQEQSSHYSTSKFKLKQVLGTKDEHSELKAALRNMGLTRSQAMRALKAVNYSSANDAANWHFANGGGSSAHNGSSNNNASRRPRKPNSVCVWIEGSGWYDPRLPNGYAMQRHGGKPYFINHVKRTTSWDDPRPLPRGFRKQGKFFRTPQGNRTKIDPRPAVQPGTTDFHKGICLDPPSASTMTTHKTVIIVRHAQSEYNLAMRTAATWFKFDFWKRGFDPFIVDPELSDVGLRQTAEARDFVETSNFLETLEVESIVVSPLRRALQTAHALFPQASELVVAPNAREIMEKWGDVGTEGHELAQQFPKHAPALQSLPQQWWGEGHPSNEDSFKPESRADVKARVSTLCEELRSREENVIVLVGHSMLFKRLLSSGRKLRNCEIVRCVLTPHEDALHEEEVLFRPS